MGKKHVTFLENQILAGIIATNTIQKEHSIMIHHHHHHHHHHQVSTCHYY